ncbi:hypothetical protein [Microcoleus sp. FACHB-672]|uniref:hypothetical protein n=1 Tax=Microcoleus sp. FACHB-672 TaxID=2692825 RepID=UPI0016857192|nr:hypothetical protein [Microcoleus sp. FACHB-672]MBD2043433.1 hypothetical protein [Microcoleus sp. FACHB-672]
MSPARGKFGYSRKPPNLKSDGGFDGGVVRTPAEECVTLQCRHTQLQDELENPQFLF